MDKIITVKGYPFVNHVEQITKETQFNLTQILDAQSNHGNQYDVYSNGYIKVMGYKYNVKQYLKHYVGKTVHGNLVEGYALNKTNFRALNHCKMIFILEVK